MVEVLLDLVVRALMAVALAAIPYLVQKVTQYLISKTSHEELVNIKMLADKAVWGAEQGLKDEGNQRKLNHALESFVGSLQKYGITLDEKDVTDFIEESYLLMKQGLKSADQPVIEVTQVEKVEKEG